MKRSTKFSHLVFSNTEDSGKPNKPKRGNFFAWFTVRLTELNYNYLKKCMQLLGLSSSCETNITKGLFVVQILLFLLSGSKYWKQILILITQTHVLTARIFLKYFPKICFWLVFGADVYICLILFCGHPNYMNYISLSM